MTAAPPSRTSTLEVEQKVDELATGKVIANRWRVLALIGTGTMGAVYHAEHVDSGTVAALKVMHPRLLLDEAMRARFRQEAMVTAAVRSEHIVEVLDAGTDGDTPYIAMELLEGVSLTKLLDRPLSIQRCLEILTPVARALDVTNDAGIVHRDVTPNNVFVTSTQVKVLDYGVAKIVSQNPHAAATLAAGTPLYMSPEQLRGDGNIDAASDRLALAHVAFTMLTGAPYWQEEKAAGKKVFRLVSAILSGPPEAASVRAIRRGVSLPQGFDDWFAKATHDRREMRFPSAHAQVDALAQLFGIEPTGVAEPVPEGIDEGRCEHLASRAMAGDDIAWQTLVGELWPFWLGIVRRNRAMGPLGRQDDHVHDVVARLVEKMSPRGGAAFGSYPTWRERNPRKGFADWLRIVTVFTIRDHVRHTLGRAPSRDPELPSAKRLLNELVASPRIDEVGGVRPAYTTAQLAQQLIAFAQSHLSALQLDALLGWLQGAGFEEIGESLNVEPAVARKTLRSAIAILRRNFNEAPS